MTPDTTWMAEAACRGKDTALFYPASGDHASAERAKAVCAGCPVREACLDYAVVNADPFGIWGGLAESGRRRLRRVRRIEAPETAKRRCPGCDVVFMPRDVRQEYCTGTCRRTSAMRRYRGRREAV